MAFSPRAYSPKVSRSSPPRGSRRSTVTPLTNCLNPACSASIAGLQSRLLAEQEEKCALVDVLTVLKNNLDEAKALLHAEREKQYALSDAYDLPQSAEQLRMLVLQERRTRMQTQQFLSDARSELSLKDAELQRTLDTVRLEVRKAKTAGEVRMDDLRAAHKEDLKEQERRLTEQFMLQQVEKANEERHIKQSIMEVGVMLEEKNKALEAGRKRESELSSQMELLLNAWKGVSPNFVQFSEAPPRLSYPLTQQLSLKDQSPDVSLALAVQRQGQPTLSPAQQKMHAGVLGLTDDLSVQVAAKSMAKQGAVASLLAERQKLNSSPSRSPRFGPLSPNSPARVTSSPIPQSSSHPSPLRLASASPSITAQLNDIAISGEWSGSPTTEEHFAGSLPRLGAVTSSMLSGYRRQLEASKHSKSITNEPVIQAMLEGTFFLKYYMQGLKSTKPRNKFVWLSPDLCFLMHATARQVGETPSSRTCTNPIPISSITKIVRGWHGVVFASQMSSVPHNAQNIALSIEYTAPATGESKSLNMCAFLPTAYRDWLQGLVMLLEWSKTAADIYSSNV